MVRTRRGSSGGRLREGDETVTPGQPLHPGEVGAVGFSGPFGAPTAAGPTASAERPPPPHPGWRAPTSSYCESGRYAREGGDPGQQSAHSLPGCSQPLPHPPHPAGARWILRRDDGGVCEAGLACRGCQLASSTPGASQVFERGFVNQKEGQSQQEFLALHQDSTVAQDAGTLLMLPVAHPNHHSLTSPVKLKTFQLHPFAFLPFGNSYIWGGALRDTHTVGS